MSLREKGNGFSIRISELQDQDKINPRPNEKTESEYLLEEFLSPPRLREITGHLDLTNVTHLQMVVDTTENSLGNFGGYLPNLKELDLSNSVLSSVRDLGSSLFKLEVLWLTRCQLGELDGISTFYKLVELYLAYNHINNLNDLSMMESLSTLDMEANDIDDIEQILFIEMCMKLQNVCFLHNPICTASKPMMPFDPQYNYRSEVIKMLPQIKTLDDIPVSDESQNFMQLDEDLQLVTENIKLGVSADGENERPGSSSSAAGRPGSAVLRRPGSARPRSAMPSLMQAKPQFGHRPPTASIMERPMTSAAKTFYSLPGRPDTGSSIGSSDSAIDVDEFSKLTAGDIVCGNPLKALRQRKAVRTARKAATPQVVPTTEKINRVSEVDEDYENILEELREWKDEFEGKGKVAMSEEVNILTLGGESNEGPEEKPQLAPQSEKSPEHRKSSANLRRRQYLLNSASSDYIPMAQTLHDECFDDVDSGLASSRDTDTPATIPEYEASSGSRGPFRSSNSKSPQMNQSGAAGRMSIKPPLIPPVGVSKEFKLQKEQKLKTVKPPARSPPIIDGTKHKMNPALLPPHKIALASKTRKTPSPISPLPTTKNSMS